VCELGVKKSPEGKVLDQTTPNVGGGGGGCLEGGREHGVSGREGRLKRSFSGWVIVVCRQRASPSIEKKPAKTEHMCRGGRDGVSEESRKKKTEEIEGNGPPPAKAAKKVQAGGP